MEELSSYFHPIETGNPEIFLGGVIKLFARYPQEVIDKALDVSIGLPAKHKWWPRISEIKETLDDLHWPIKFANNWEAKALEQIALRRTAITDQSAQASLPAPTPQIAWHEQFGISRAEWDAIPNLPETFNKLPAPQIPSPKEDTTGPPGEDAA